MMEEMLPNMQPPAHAAPRLVLSASCIGLHSLLGGKVLVGTRSLPRGTPPEELVSSCKRQGRKNHAQCAPILSCQCGEMQLRLLTSPMIFPDIKDAMLREGVKELLGVHHGRWKHMKAEKPWGKLLSQALYDWRDVQEVRSWFRHRARHV